MDTETKLFALTTAGQTKTKKEAASLKQPPLVIVTTPF
jgi:hypothetical protein